jgi:HEAT repeat protein
LSHTEFVGTVQDFIAGLRSSDAQERVDSAWALSEMGRDALDALPALIDALKDDEDRVVACACDALKNLRPESAAAVAALRELLKSKRKAVAKEAELTLLAIEDPQAYERLMKSRRLSGCLMLSAAGAAFIVGVFLLLRLLRL